MPEQIKIFKNAISKKICEETISKFKKDKTVKKDPQPDYSTRLYLKVSEFKNWNQACNPFYKAIGKTTEKYFSVPEGFEEIAQPEWADEGLVMAHYRPGDDCAMHVDGPSVTPPHNHHRLATLIFFLNTVRNGGRIVFPFQKRSIAPEAGMCLIFPPTLHFPHYVETTREDRFVLQSWIIDPAIKTVLS